MWGKHLRTDERGAQGAGQVKAPWSRIVFSGRGVPPKEVSDATAVKKAIVADSKSVGYIDKVATDSSVKVVLTLD